MLHPSLQLDFYDPIASFEISTYNRFILSLFVVILIRLGLILACRHIDTESSQDFNILFTERRVFISSCIIVLALCVPRLIILYRQSPDTPTRYTLPVTAYQWYWTIRWGSNETELYMEQKPNGATHGAPFLIETSDCRVVPIGLTTNFFVTSNDVLHSFSLPSAFVKCDAVPRRLNSLSLLLTHPGIMYRQCSELCRVRHSYIPIKVEVVIPVSAI